MGLLLAGLGGMASQGIDIINKRQEDEQAQAKEARAAATQKSMAEYQNELAMKREAATLELQKKYRRDEETYQASPERVTQLAKADEMKTDLGKTTRDKLFAESLANYKSKSAAELEAEVKKLTDPNYLKGKRAEALATNIDNGAGLRAVQLEAATYALNQEKRKQTAIDSYLAEPQDSPKKQSMFKDLVARGILKDKDEGFIERTVKTTDKDNNEITEKYKVRPGSMEGSKGEEVRIGGVVIGKASNSSEAQALVKAHLDKNKQGQSDSKPKPTITKNDIKIGTPAADTGGLLGSKQQYNVTINGVSSVKTVDELERMGFTFNQVRGKKVYDAKYDADSDQLKRK